MDRIEHVKKLREEYERALDAAESRRSAYHDAVLELYRGGTPLREIATELGLSHQRVHQIVSGEPPRGRKLPRAAGGAAGAVLLLAAAIFGALRLAHASPFAIAPLQESIPNVVGQPAYVAIHRLEDVGLQAHVFYVERHDGLVLRHNEVLSQRGPAGALVARGSVISLYVATDHHVAIRPATRFIALHQGRGFVPGGAVLSEGREVFSSVSPIGPVSLWGAPDRVSRSGGCIWLEIAGRGVGGSCYQRARRGIPELVPYVSSSRGPGQRVRSLPLIWGRIDTTVARLTLVFQDGRQVSVPLDAGMFLYTAPVSQSRLRSGHQPSFLVARDAHGREVDRRPIRLDLAATY